MSFLDVLDSNASASILGHLAIEDRKSLRLVRRNFTNDVHASIESMTCTCDEEVRFSLRFPFLKKIRLDNPFGEESDINAWLAAVQTRRIEDVTYHCSDMHQHAVPGPMTCIDVSALPPSVTSFYIETACGKLSLTPSTTLKSLRINDYCLVMLDCAFEGFTSLEKLSLCVGDLGYHTRHVLNMNPILDFSNTRLKTIRVDSLCELILPATAVVVHAHGGVITNKTFAANPPLRSFAWPMSYKSREIIDTSRIWRYMEVFAISVYQIPYAIPPRGVTIVREPGLAGMCLFLMIPDSAEEFFEDDAGINKLRGLATIAPFVRAVVICCEDVAPFHIDEAGLREFQAIFPRSIIEIEHDIDSYSQLDLSVKM